MKMSDNPAKHEVLFKQYLRSILAISEKKTKRITKDSQRHKLDDSVSFTSYLLSSVLAVTSLCSANLFSRSCCDIKRQTGNCMAFNSWRDSRASEICRRSSFFFALLAFTVLPPKQTVAVCPSRKVQPKFFKFVVCNPCQFSTSLTIFVFFYSELLSL